MSFLNLGYGDRFNGENKTVFRDEDELVYTVNPQDLMRVIGDEAWYDEAALQVRVWEHNIEQLQQSEVPLTFDDYNSDMMFYEVSDERIDGKLTAPAIRTEDHIFVEPYDYQETFGNISDSEEEQIRQMQEELDQLIADGEIAVQERELVENDYRGPGCLRQFGRTVTEEDETEVYLLEFGEYHNQLEGPMTGQEFLEEHEIPREKHGIRNPVMLGDMSGYAWQED